MPNNTNLARVLQYIVREIESNNIHFIQLNDLSLQEQSREKILKSIKLKTPITREKNRF